MAEKPYHHGDLRNALIEAGINLIHEKGVQSFSLRNAAIACGVSHTAPYAHFKSLDAFMQAMREHVTEQFMNRFRLAVQGQSRGPELITTLGKAYITFFAENPNYFSFLFYHSGVQIDLDHDDASDSYPPFLLFRDAAYEVLDATELPPAAKKRSLIAMWSLVHGITALLTNKNIRYTGDWHDILCHMHMPKDAAAPAGQQEPRGRND